MESLLPAAAASRSPMCPVTVPMCVSSGRCPATRAGKALLRGVLPWLALPGLANNSVSHQLFGRIPVRPIPEPTPSNAKASRCRLHADAAPCSVLLRAPCSRGLTRLTSGGAVLEQQVTRPVPPPKTRPAAGAIWRLGFAAHSLRESQVTLPANVRGAVFAQRLRRQPTLELIHTTYRPDRNGSAFASFGVDAAPKWGRRCGATGCITR